MTWGISFASNFIFNMAQPSQFYYSHGSCTSIGVGRTIDHAWDAHCASFDFELTMSKETVGLRPRNANVDVHGRQPL